MPRRIAKISAPYLERVTVWYLERHTTSAAHLRRLLMRRVHRSVGEHGTDLAEAIALVDTEIVRLEGIGLLDDARYAAEKARSLRRRGASTNRVRSALRAKGVDADTVAAVQTLPCDLETEGIDPDLAAACVWARKRRIGPWRTGAVDPELRRKEIARLGRAGFSWDLARRIVDASEPDALERPERG